MDRESYNNPTIQQKLAKNFVAIKINPELSATNRTLSGKYGVRGYPNIFFLDGDGNVVGKLGGYLPMTQFAGVLDKMLERLPPKPQEKPVEKSDPPVAPPKN